MTLQDFYAGKRVLVTGHTGFKGGWLTLMLHRLGATVAGIALEPRTTDDFYAVNRLDALCESHLADLADVETVKEIITRFRPDLVFHLAAQPLVRYSYSDPLETFRTNALGTAHVLDAVRHLPGKCAVVAITTDKVYENTGGITPYAETDRLGGKDAYSASKACAELVAASYRHSFFNPATVNSHGKALATARAGNVIGGGDWSPDRLIPDIVRALRDGTEVVLRHPGAVRPWQHVLDPLMGYLLLGQKLADDPEMHGGGWNFGPLQAEAFTVEEITRAAIAALGHGSYRIQADPGAPHEEMVLQLDSSRAHSMLGWTPLLDIHDSIKLTLGWYNRLLTDRTSILDFSIQMTDEYLSRACP